MIDIDIRKKLLGAHGEMELHFQKEIKRQEFVALAGQSGSGKTTLLRILAGLEEGEGYIRIGDEVWMDKGFSKPPQQRRIGFVFQDYALFANMSVEKNLLYVSPDKALAAKLLEMTGLNALKNRLPSTLSGGQKQRVSLCRAMMNRPKLLLMDEPLSALDPAMRKKLQHEILLLHREFGTTTIMVSHDPSEIYRLAGRVIMLELGEVVGDGTPKEVLMRMQGSQKFSFAGELLDIRRIDVIYVAVVAIGQQLVEVVLDEMQAQQMEVGDMVNVSTKAFTPMIVQNQRS